MQKIFFTADTHFGHENVIQFDKRPFASADEMDKEMIRRWNNKVGNGDLVYVLGDMIWKTPGHYFIPFYNGHRSQAILLHGHSHSSEEHKIESEIAKELNKRGFQNEIYNVGCMHWNYEPVTLDEIIGRR